VIKIYVHQKTHEKPRKKEFITLLALTFKNCASYIYIGRAYRYPPHVAFYIFF